MYQRIDLSGPTAKGNPGPLPAELVGLADESLADIPTAINPTPKGYAKTGFWPVTVNVPPIDPRAETLTDEYAVSLNIPNRTAFADQGKRPLTTEETAALPPPPPIVVQPADLWRRATEAEAEAIEGAMASQSAKLRNLFRSASTYQSDDPLWPVLMGAATQIFGAERAAELLAASG